VHRTCIKILKKLSTQFLILKLKFNIKWQRFWYTA